MVIVKKYWGKETDIAEKLKKDKHPNTHTWIPKCIPSAGMQSCEKRGKDVCVSEREKKSVCDLIFV